jgi:hypothetical protein
MPALFDVLYREYCRARLAEMRKQLPLNREVAAANGDAVDCAGSVDTASNLGDGWTATSHEGGDGAPK